MKKVTTIFVALLAGLSLMASGVFAQDQLSQEDMQAMQQMMQQMQAQMEQVSAGDYVNEAELYSVTIPDGFSGMQMQEALTVVKGGMQAMMGVGASGEFPLSFAIVSAPRDEETPESINDADFDKMVEAQVASMSQDPNNSARIVKSEKIKLNGKDCMYFVTEVTVEGAALETTNYILIENNKLYYLVFTYPQGKYDAYKDEISSIAGTFQIQ